VMRKMKADSLPDLVTMAARLGCGLRRGTPTRSSPTALMWSSVESIGSRADRQR